MLLHPSSRERLVIIGAGPAGYTAAIYAARAMLRPLLLAGFQPGGQLMITSDVENYPGFASAIEGPWLMEQMRAQTQHVGARIEGEHVVALDLAVRPFRIHCDSGRSLTAEAIILATGAKAKWLDLPSEHAFKGFGVSACATCDGFFFRGKEIVVIGGGDSAMEEASFLTKFASKVTVIHRRAELRASKIMQDRAFGNPKIEWIWNSAVTEILGSREGGVTGVRLHNLETGEEHEFPTQGVFYAIGHSPNTRIFAGKLDMNEVGYIKVLEPSSRTNVPGVFASGDACDPTYRQAISAAGTGCRAAIDAERWLGELHD